MLTRLADTEFSPPTGDPASADETPEPLEGQEGQENPQWIQALDGHTREEAEREARHRTEEKAGPQQTRRARPETTGRADPAEQQSGASIRPPSQAVVKNGLVRKTFAELIQPGRLLFNPPHQMNSARRNESRSA